jgi:hypothetical protein
MLIIFDRVALVYFGGERGVEEENREWFRNGGTRFMYWQST